jgi:hypothetical protein
MANFPVLGYARSGDDRPTGTAPVTILLAFVLMPCHAFYCWGIGLLLFGLWGGIRQSGAWTQYGGVDYAWTNLPWFPGPVLGGSGLLLMLIGSIASAYVLSSAIARALYRERPIFGRYRWRLSAILIGWVIRFPVPVKLAAVYWWSVAY